MLRLDRNILARLRARRWRFGLAVTVVMLGAGFWWRGGPAPVWRSEPVTRADIESSVAAIGTLQPLSSVEVGAQVSGQITRLHVVAGDVVAKGQLLAEIDASVHQATVDAGRAELAGLRAELADARAQHELARQQYIRQQRLAAANATREEDVQTAAATLASAEARIDRLKAGIERTASTLKGDEAQLGYTRIYAPIAGTVTGIDAKEGQTLNATYQTPTVLRIADLSRMTVWTDVSEADIRRVRAGMTVYFTTLGGDHRRWSGLVRQVLPAPRTQPAQSGSSEGAAQAGAGAGKAVHYTVLFDVDNNDGELMPQMTAQVVFVVASARQVLTAPLQALEPFEERPDWYWVRVLGRGGDAVERAVRIGRRDDLRAEVIEGLNEGELLVTGRLEASAPGSFQL